MKTIKRGMLFGILIICVSSCSGIYNCMDANGRNGDRPDNKDRIRFDINTDCDN